jgi:BirA family transcriptional regulator, biotin operon repressor / biotin---[acetyl-CoA-carboxylase] ligase
MLAMAARGEAREGDWLIADAQTGGRGRIGRVWQSPRGNFYGSGLVRLQPGDSDAATLALVAAVAVYETLAIWCDAKVLRIKWPNDVLAHGAKINGVLLERADDAIVVGIGVNLTLHPVLSGRPATSLTALGVVPPDTQVFGEALAEAFARWLQIWRGQGLEPVRRAWLDRAHPVGTALTANLPDGNRVEGLFDGLTPDCALRLRLADGTNRVIHAGDVFLI